MLGERSSASSVSAGDSLPVSTASDAPYNPGAGGEGSRSYSGQSSTSTLTGTSATTTPRWSTWKLSPSVTHPIVVAGTSHRSHTPSTSPTRSGVATHSIRSCDSDTMISNGSIPASRSGIWHRSSVRPTPPLLAISDAAEVSPAAPRSCNETSSSRSSSSRQHSSNFFSVNGSPIWTDGRFRSSPSPSSALASTEAPPIPSRPVSAPSRITTLPVPAAALRISRSCGASPRHIALTRQFCS